MLLCVTHQNGEEKGIGYWGTEEKVLAKLSLRLHMVSYKICHLCPHPPYPRWFNHLASSKSLHGSVSGDEVQHPRNHWSCSGVKRPTGQLIIMVISHFSWLSEEDVYDDTHYLITQGNILVKFTLKDNNAQFRPCFNRININTIFIFIFIVIIFITNNIIVSNKKLRLCKTSAP